MQKIILVGYMAVGKTTIAALLSEKIGLKTIDLDKLIENRVGLPIIEIFEKKGEIYFRKVEHELFKELVQNGEDLIISTGGGTPCYANNHLFLNGKNTVSIYLKASLDLILERLPSEKNGRPLVANKSAEELKEFVAIHLFERSYFYNQANFTISIDAKSPEDITKEIIGILN
jgi:shikimate kinase